MPDQQPEEVEALVDTLTIDGAALNDAQLSALSGCDLQQLAELSHELHLNSEMEPHRPGEGELMEVQEVAEPMNEEIVDQTEIGGQEEVVETERAATPEEILPDVGRAKAVVPPLRPLTIAPKPAKVPLTIKPVAGQQLLLLQGEMLSCCFGFVWVVALVLLAVLVGKWRGC